MTYKTKRNVRRAFNATKLPVAYLLCLGFGLGLFLFTLDSCSHTQGTEPPVTPPILTVVE